MESFDIMQYLQIAIRRKYFIIIPFLLCLLGGLAYALVTPPVYSVETLILVQAQKVPSDYVRSIISTPVEGRLHTITQQVTSRTNLEKIIKEYDLYTDREMFLDEKVGLLRSMINIRITGSGGRRDSGGNAFTISLRGKNPRKLTLVTNALASNFINENLKIRESQAIGTSAFLVAELENLTNQLREHEVKLEAYRMQHMGGLPDQLQANLGMLERLQMQQDQLNNNLRDSENRKLILQKQISDSAAVREELLHARRLLQRESRLQQRDLIPAADEGLENLDRLRSRLVELESIYTAHHPDVVRIKKLIEKLENGKTNQETKDPKKDTNSKADNTAPAPSESDMDLVRQLHQVNLGIQGLRAEIQKTEERTKRYQKRVEETPKREQELLTLNRTYENLKELHGSMMNRKLEADIAVSMEKKQKGEQFKILDPAKIPTHPIDPDFRKILAMILALGLGSGAGAAYLREILDPSLKTPEELEKVLQLPVLVNLPMHYTEREEKKRKWKGFLRAASITAGFVFSAIGIVVAVKGLDTTTGYVKNILSEIGIL